MQASLQNLLHMNEPKKKKKRTRQSRLNQKAQAAYEL